MRGSAYGPTVVHMNTTTCEHLDNTSTSVTPGEPVSAWECDNCGHLTPFTAEDYAFHADLWAPEDVTA